MIRLLPLALAVFLSSQLALGALKRPKNDAEAVRVLMDNLVAAWNKHDTKAMAAYFAEEATVVNPLGRWASGRDQIEALFKDEHAGPMKSSRVSSGELKLQKLGGELAFFDWDMEIASMSDPEGSEMPPLRHHVAGVVAKRRNQWWVVTCRPYMSQRPPSPETALK